MLFQNDDVVNVEQIINICDSSLWTTLTSNLVATVYATMELHCSSTVMWSLMTILSIESWMLDVDISLQSKYFTWATCCPNKAIANLHDKELKKYFSRHMVFHDGVTNACRISIKLISSWDQAITALANTEQYCSFKVPSSFNKYILNSSHNQLLVGQPLSKFNE